MATPTRPFRAAVIAMVVCIAGAAAVAGGVLALHAGLDSPSMPSAVRDLYRWENPAGKRNWAGVMDVMVPAVLRGAWSGFATRRLRTGPALPAVPASALVVTLTCLATTRLSSDAGAAAATPHASSGVLASVFLKSLATAWFFWLFTRTLFRASRTSP
jgi:hypothetical protein